MAGSSLLLALSALAFAREGQTSVMALLVGPLPGAAALVLPAVAAAAIVVALVEALRRWGSAALRLPRPTGLDALGVMAVLGALLLYHRNYDNIMLAPAMLALFQRSLRHQSRATIAVTAALALSLWLPTRVVLAFPPASGPLPIPSLSSRPLERPSPGETRTGRS